tara:strand:- start:233 stop:1225 length:993 start_codon:yes stop_codon:yes gene_type:complete
MKKAFALAAVFIVLTGCSESVLDWRNASVSGGKVYEGDSNEPFTGKVTNIPENSIPFSEVFNDIHYSFNQSMGNFNARNQQFVGRHLTCDTHVIDGFIEGDTSCRDNSGALRWSANIFGDGFDGEVKIYDTTGNTALIVAEFAGGAENGVRRIFSPNTGNLLGEFHYKDGKMHGEQRSWIESGTLVQKYNTLNGFKVGYENRWAPNGQMIYEMPWNGKNAEGVAKSWDAETGQQLTQVTYVDGERVGPVKQWNVDGTLEIDGELLPDGTLVKKNEAQAEENSETTTTIDQQECFEQWISAYRREVGEDAMVNMEQMGEWEQWCSEGKMPE